MITDELVAFVLQRYRTTLLAVSKACGQALPIPGPELTPALQALESCARSDSAAIEQVSTQVDSELTAWSGSAAQYYQTKTEEVKEIMVTVARVAGSISQRDQQYAEQVGELGQRLLAAARLDDLSQIRSSLANNAGVLNATAEAMKKSSQDSVNDLRAEVVRYEKLLRESEQLVYQDPLTSLQNRRGIEEELRLRTEQNRHFCIMMLDLNDFKTLNDTYGHVAGDDLLKQFAQELKAHSDQSDFAGRLGGDEFIIITERTPEEAETYLNRIRSWIFGSYKVHDGQGLHSVSLTGSAGLAAWNGQENLSSLLSRADQAMYREKVAFYAQHNRTAKLRRGA
jgi:diguanylate cyclase (GGDEF)-like protein